MKPGNLAVIAAVALLALFATVDGLRTDGSSSAPATARAVAAEPRAPAPTPPSPTSRHVQKLMKSDVDLHAVRANRTYCRRDLAVVCFGSNR